MSSRTFVKSVADAQEIIVISDDEDEQESEFSSRSGCVPTKRRRTSGQASMCEHEERNKQIEEQRCKRAAAWARLPTKAQKMARAHVEAKEKGIEQVPQIGENTTTRTMDHHKTPEEEKVTFPVEKTLPQVQLEILRPDDTLGPDDAAPTEPLPEEEDDVKDASDETSSEEEDDEEEKIKEKMKMDSDDEEESDDSTESEEEESDSSESD